MDIVVLISIIGLLIVVVAVSLSVGDVLFKRPDKGGERLVVNSSAPVSRDTAAPVAPPSPATTPSGVGYLDEQTDTPGREPAPAHAPEPVPALLRAGRSSAVQSASGAESAPVGVGYLDEPLPAASSAPSATTAWAGPTAAPDAGSAPVGVGYLDEPDAVAPSAPAAPSAGASSMPAARRAGAVSPGEGSAPVGVGYLDEPVSAQPGPARGS